ncbi:MAG: DNA-directed RNA polymerase subunit omega [Clostridia bacterium]|nr:DNA-directed RNA polymerase subunit omega [Clostridia bacterium]
MFKMMVKPSVSELLEKVDDRYELVVITSKRARQLAEGAEPLTNKKEHSKVTLAAQEIAEGKVVMVDGGENEE